MYGNPQNDPRTNIPVYLCVKTNKSYPKKGDYKNLSTQSQALYGDYISIDHETDYRTYIMMNNSGDGSEVTNPQAQAAYNDVSNLCLVCQKRNSAKGDR
ncbi:MAG: hypothetical protein WA902_07220 [Thermosynechococcaceae cyanobacterium]